jgi:hypothetical protein
MPADLKQVAALFNNCIETIRNEEHAGLEKMTIEWLKGTRYEVMRKIEAECAKCFLYYFHSQLATNKNLDTINSHIRSTIPPYKEAGHSIQMKSFQSTLDTTQ